MRAPRARSLVRGFTLLELIVALSLLAWYVFAPQCISTLATIKRETGSWKQNCISTVYLFAQAYGAALLTYQVAVALGAG